MSKDSYMFIQVRHAWACRHAIFRGFLKTR